MTPVQALGSRLLLSVAFLVVLLLGSAGRVRAAPSTTASGTYAAVSETLTLIQTADGNSIYAGSDISVYQGDLTGTVTDSFTLIVHADGSFNGHGTETCIAGCTLAGRTGGFTAVFTLTVAGSQREHHFTFTGGSGGLAGLHGEGTYTTTTYAYAYHFVP